MKSRRNLHIMYAVALLHGMVFYAPIASLYRQAAGLGIAQIALIEGISYLFALAMELPFGLPADRIGYRRTMITGCGLYFLSKLIFWRAEDFAAFLLERLVLSAALAAFSGVDESILYLSCPEGDSQRAFARYDACSTAGLCFLSAALGCGVLVFTRSAQLSMVCIAVISVSGALMYPLGAAICNRRVQNPNRATMLSIFAIVQGIAAAGMEAICGRAAEFSLDAALCLCALACLAACACFLHFCRSVDA